MDDGASDFVRLADHLAPSNPATRVDATVRLRPMIPTTPLDILDLGCPAMLTDTQHRRLIQQSPVIEVGDESGQCLIQSWQQLVLEARIMIPVRIPARAGQAVLVPEHRDKT